MTPTDPVSAAAAPDGAHPAAPDAPAPVPVRTRSDGWTAHRQRTFLSALAETGSISTACHVAGVSARSAYRLRARPDAAPFAQAWSRALEVATGRLMTLAFERATRGAVREVWKDGHLLTQTRVPSDKLLMFLIQRASTPAPPLMIGGGMHGLAMPGESASRSNFSRVVETLADLEPVPDAPPLEPPGVLPYTVHPDRTDDLT